MRYVVRAGLPGLLTCMSAAATLTGPGDIAFTGWNADGNDDFSFVALVDINPAESIAFTDNEWDGAAFNAGEGEITWTAATTVPAGTVVSITNAATTISASTGLVSGNMSLDNSDEALFALIGTLASPTAFLTAFSNDGAVGFSTLAGTGLTLGITAIDFDGTSAEDDDIYAYFGPRSGEADFSNYVSSINNTANWISQDGGGDQSTDAVDPDIPFDTTSFSVVPDTDGDGVPDTDDNCILEPNGPLMPDAGGNSQYDSNGDGYGNICDADLNNDLVINGLDVGPFVDQFGTSGPDADLNGDGVVNGLDVGFFIVMFGQAPGPSGIAP